MANETKRVTTRSRWRARRWAVARSLAWLAVAGTTLFVGAYVLFVQTTWGQRLDNAALAGRALQPINLQSTADDLLSTIQLGSIGVALAAITALGYRSGRWHVALPAAGTLVGAVGAAEVWKHLMPRPELLPDGSQFGAGNSFPSGHATIAMATAFALMLAAPAAERRLFAVLGTLYALGIGGAVVLAGWHRPSDVVGSYGLVTAVGAAAALVALSLAGEDERGSSRPRRSATPTWSMRRGMIALPAGALLAWLAGLAVLSLATGDAPGPRAALGLGLSGPAAIGATLAATYCWLLEQERVPTVH